MNGQNSQDAWIEEMRRYCRELNIETGDLYSVLTDPKVAPMIRGKAFEFSVSLRLSHILPEDEWQVSKPTLNAQTGSHDVDVKVLHNRTGRVISVECKLASKGGFKISKNQYIVPVKCMRSRTTKTPAKVAAGARALGVPPEAFLAHSDQYRASHFDVVATSLANAFYETDRETMSYVFQPSAAGVEFLRKLNPPADIDLQTFVYNKVYIARSVDLAVSRDSGVVCIKRACTNKYDCGFIPNYPLINFGEVIDAESDAVLAPTNHWIELDDSLPVFERFIADS
ncbi:MAG: hypothetical protein ICV60_04175 [Pyrinomonadaceae bacterium]|nr:hypothetical protein [Pyrinomonadaceae bacterium]